MTPALHVRAAKWLVALVVFLCMLPFASQLVVHHPDERHYAYAGARMVETGGWMIPVTPQGDVRLKKPILPYWFSAAGFVTAGENVLGFRLFTLLGGCAILLLTYALARAFGASRPTALLAEVLLAGNPVLLRGTVVANPDVPMTLFMLLSGIGFVGMLFGRDEKPPSRYAWFAWVGAALATLAKGLLAGVFVVFVLLFALVVDRRRLPALLTPLPIAVAAGLVLGWYAYAFTLYPGEFVSQFFSDQIGEKVAYDFFSSALTFPGYLAVMAISFIFWPFVLAFGIRPGLTPIHAWPSPVKLAMAWCVVVAAVFSIGGEVVERYALPALPFLAAMLAMALGGREGERWSRLSGISRGLLVVLVLIGIAAILLGLVFEVALATSAKAAAFVLVGTAIWAAVLIVGWTRHRLAPYLLGMTPALLMTTLVVPVSLLVMPDIGTPLAQRLRAIRAPADRVFWIGDVHDAAGLRLSLGKADAFREEGPLTPDVIGEACAVATSDAEVADQLRQNGFAVETVTGGWRKIDVGVLMRAVLDGRLAEARNENADRGYVAVNSSNDAACRAATPQS
jgi:4-amino-4-deoxy-L-arabinose transferase-like glycosyltransferase